MQNWIRNHALKDPLWTGQVMNCTFEKANLKCTDIYNRFYITANLRYIAFKKKLK